MLLARAAAERPTEMRADLQRFFGIDADMLGRGVSAWQMASCLACVPRGSAILAGIEPSSAYTVGDTYLHAILCALSGKWEPFPWQRGEETENALPKLGEIGVSEFEEWLSKDWKEDGQCLAL